MIQKLKLRDVIEARRCAYAMALAAWREDSEGERTVFAHSPNQALLVHELARLPSQLIIALSRRDEILPDGEHYDPEEILSDILLSKLPLDPEEPTDG